MTIVLHKTLILLALISSPVFAKSLRHHKRESRAKEPARAWAVKHDAKTEGNRDSEERNYGSQVSNVLSGSKGHRRFYRDNDRYGSETNDRLSSNFQRVSRDAAGENSNLIGESNLTIKRRGNDQEMEEDRALSRSQMKRKRSSEPLGKVEEEEYFEGDDAKYDRMSDPDEAHLDGVERGPGYGNQMDGLSDEGINGDSDNAEVFDTIEEGEAVEGEADSDSAIADGISDLDSRRDSIEDAEDGVAAEVSDDTQSVYGGSPETEEAQRHRRNLRNGAMRDVSGQYGMRRSSAQRNQDDEETQREEDADEEWDGAEYNGEKSAVDFPYEKGYLKVKGLDYNLGSDEVEFEGAEFVAHDHVPEFKMGEA